MASCSALSSAPLAELTRPGPEQGSHESRVHYYQLGRSIQGQHVGLRYERVQTVGVCAPRMLAMMSAASSCACSCPHASALSSARKRSGCTAPCKHAHQQWHLEGNVPSARGSVLPGLSIMRASLLCRLPGDM